MDFSMAFHIAFKSKGIFLERRKKKKRTNLQEVALVITKMKWIIFVEISFPWSQRNWKEREKSQKKAHTKK